MSSYGKRRSNTRYFVRNNFVKGKSRCYYCQCKLYYDLELMQRLTPAGLLYTLPDNFATCEHLISKNNILSFLVDRELPKYKVLACYACNQHYSYLESGHSDDRPFISLLSMLKTSTIFTCETIGTNTQDNFQTLRNIKRY